MLLKKSTDSICFTDNIFSLMSEKSLFLVEVRYCRYQHWFVLLDNVRKIIRVHTIQRQV